MLWHQHVCIVFPDYWMIWPWYSPLKACSHPQIWKTVEEWRKKKSRKEHRQRKMRTTDRPMKMVAARKAGVGMEEKSSSLPSQRRSCPSWRRRHDFHSPKYPVPLEDSVSPSHLLCMGKDQIRSRWNIDYHNRWERKISRLTEQQPTTIIHKVTEVWEQNACNWIRVRASSSIWKIFLDMITIAFMSSLIYQERQLTEVGQRRQHW